jgi:AcrR family transcriptional regulator
MNRRSYSMGVRAEKAEATRQRILEVTRALFDSRSTDFPLERVAADAGTSVQTVLRAFGSKNGLLMAAIGSVRGQPLAPDRVPDSVDDAVTQLVGDYEEIGDRVIRMLAEERRVAGFAAAAADGRANHRAWVEAVFAADLDAVPAGRRQALLTALLAVTDVYVWKLLRRDLALDRAAVEATVRGLVVSVLATGPAVADQAARRPAGMPGAG